MSEVGNTVVAYCFALIGGLCLIWYIYLSLFDLPKYDQLLKVEGKLINVEIAEDYGALFDIVDMKTGKTIRLKSRKNQTHEVYTALQQSVPSSIVAVMTDDKNLNGIIKALQVSINGQVIDPYESYRLYKKKQHKRFLVLFFISLACIVVIKGLRV